MLFEMLDDICAEIAAIDLDEAVPTFTRQLTLMKPGLPRGLFAEPTGEEVSWAATRLSEGYITLIKEIPWYVNTLTRAAKDPHMEGGYRAAILGSLAYLVQPRDLIPDDLPGGFGLLDDCLLLHVTTAECMAYLPRNTATTESRETLLANFLALTIPDQRLPVFREATQGIRHLIFHIGLMDPEQLTEAISSLQENPLAPGPASSPSSYRASSAPPGPDYFSPLAGREVADDGLIVLHFADGTVRIFGPRVETE